MKNKFRKIYIGKSKTHGKGLFTTSVIKKGEIIFFIKGKEIKFFITNQKKADTAGLNWIGIGKNKWIDPKGEYGAYFNHSCNPNTAITGKVTVVALCDIKKGEEITFDYSTTEGDLFWSMKCKCGSKNCRKIIKPIQFLPPETYKKYSKYLPSYYRLVYMEFNVNIFQKFNLLKEKWINFLLSKKYVK